MDLKKIKGISSSQILHYDILGNIIGIGDVVAVAYRNKMYYGLVKETNQQYLKIIDKTTIDNGNTTQIGRAITGEQCLLINKEIDKESKENLNKKLDDNETIKKSKQTETLYRILLYWKNKRDNKDGFIVISNVMKKKDQFYILLNAIQTKYPDYEFKIYMKDHSYPLLTDVTNIGNVCFYNRDYFLSYREQSIYYTTENNPITNIFFEYDRTSNRLYYPKEMNNKIQTAARYMYNTDHFDGNRYYIEIGDYFEEFLENINN